MVSQGENLSIASFHCGFPANGPSFRLNGVRVGGSWISQNVRAAAPCLLMSLGTRQPVSLQSRLFFCHQVFERMRMKEGRSRLALSEVNDFSDFSKSGWAFRISVIFLFKGGEN